MEDKLIGSPEKKKSKKCINNYNYECIIHCDSREDHNYENLYPVTAKSALSIVKARNIRLEQCKPEWRLETISRNIPSDLPGDYTFHRECYKKYINLSFQRYSSGKNSIIYSSNVTHNNILQNSANNTFVGKVNPTRVNLVISKRPCSSMSQLRYTDRDTQVDQSGCHTSQVIYTDKDAHVDLSTCHTSYTSQVSGTDRGASRDLSGCHTFHTSQLRYADKDAHVDLSECHTSHTSEVSCTDRGASRDLSGCNSFHTSQQRHKDKDALVELSEFHTSYTSQVSGTDRGPSRNLSGCNSSLTGINVSTLDSSIDRSLAYGVSSISGSSSNDSSNTNSILHSTPIKSLPINHANSMINVNRMNDYTCNIEDANMKCCFCQQKRKRVKCSFAHLIVKRPNQQIKSAAIYNGDIHVLGVLNTGSFKCHNKCYINYLRRYRHSKKYDDEKGCNTVLDDNINRSQALEQVFDILDPVVADIIDSDKIMSLNSLRNIYLDKFNDNYPQYSLSKYSLARFKAKLELKYPNSLSYYQVNKQKQYVFSSNVKVIDIIESVCKFRQYTPTNIVLQAAKLLRENIQTNYKDDNASTSWPPCKETLDEVQIPSQLETFVIRLLTGDQADTSHHKQVIASSISQDLVAAVMNQTVHMPKHVSLAIAVHHLTGSSNLITTLNRYGHCINYSKLQEIETEYAKQLTDETHCSIPPNISTTANLVTHIIWDNFDLNEETLTGAGTTHTTHGIIVQEKIKVPITKTQEGFIKPATRTHERSYKVTNIIDSDSTHLEIHPRYKFANPDKLPTVCSTESNQSMSDMSRINELVHLIWLVNRIKNVIPEWAGFISKIADTKLNTEPSTIAYLPPIMKPITDYSTINQCIDTSIMISNQVIQDYTIITMDLAAAKKAYDVIWSNPEKYDKVFILLGPFHIACSYMAAIGKMMKGSGFEEIIVQSDICSNGSVDQVLNAKQYNRSLRTHFILCEALEHLLFQTFKTDEGLCSFDSESQITANDSRIELNLKWITTKMNSPINTQLNTKWQQFKSEIRNGKLGLTATYWISYIDSINTLMYFIKAIKENSLDDYIDSLENMCYILFSADHVNYARYLSYHISQLKSCPITHPGLYELLNKGSFTSCRSNTPGCRIPLDQTIEQTINRSAKSHGGIIGFSRNCSAYTRWCLTRHINAQISESLTENTTKQNKSHPSEHKSCTNNRIVSSMQAVSKVKSAILDLTNPFDTQQCNMDELHSLSSGYPASNEVKIDLVNYIRRGQEEFRHFVDNRLDSNTDMLKKRITKLNLKTFESMSIKSNISTSQKQVNKLKVERNILTTLLGLISDDDCDMRTLLSYPLSPVPLSLATADGAMLKTDKSQLLHLLEAPVNKNRSIGSSTIDVPHVVDGSNLLYMVNLKQGSTYENFAHALFSLLPKSEELHFVTDTYHDKSIKETERHRRGYYNEIAMGIKSKVPKNFSEIMRNNDNKRKLIGLIFEEWQTDKFAPLLHHRKFFYTIDRNCYILTSQDGKTVTKIPKPELECTHEEADTRIIVHCCYLSSYAKKFVIYSQDTDVLVLLLHHASKFNNSHVIMLTGTAERKRYIDITYLREYYGEELCQALPAFHALTGCDTTSALMRRGKKQPFKLLADNSKYIQPLQRMHLLTTTTDNQLMALIEEFFSLMYGHRSTINETRYQIFSRHLTNMKKSKKKTVNLDLSLLPPCSSSLYLHILRASYQTLIWTQAHIPTPNIPDPVDRGWEMNDNGKLSCKWSTGPLLPQNVTDKLVIQNLQNESSPDDELIEIEYDIDHIVEVTDSEDESD